MKTPGQKRHGARRAVAPACALVLAQSAWAQCLATSPTGLCSSAETVEVTGRHDDNAVGSSDAASQGVVRAEMLKNRPLLRPGEVLETVPGLVVTQHSGDGKANQYFLRGFNLDHGTDFATTVNGMPANMPTHAHGQGYADLNFLIPEWVDRIEYRKGPYFARSGDFGAAGAADIVYRTRLDGPFAQVTLGEKGYARLVGAGSTGLSGGKTLLGVVEVMHNDGPWSRKEGLRRTNGVSRWPAGERPQAGRHR
jgi:outer membrane cobalamin receptor